MRLSQVIEGSGARVVAGEGDPEIRAVVYDSRRVVPGALFVCLPGQVRDGHAFAAAAAAAGAVAVLGERPVDVGGAVLLVTEAGKARRTLATCAANFAGRPGDALLLAGVTGTNGKTTIAYLYEAIAAAAGENVGVIGTVSYRFAGKSLDAPHTTPEAVELHSLLAAMREAGCGGAVMEVSSHALAQDRVAGLRFHSAAFTNLTRDHLDFHQDMETYFAAKARLFHEGLAPGAVATVNVDDPWGERLAGELKASSKITCSDSKPQSPKGEAKQTGRSCREAPVRAMDGLAVDDAGTTTWRFSTRRTDVELYARDARHGIEGIEFTLISPAGEAPIRSPLVGAHNLENLLAAAGLALGAGFPLAAVAEGLSRSTGAPGRLERVDGAGTSVFVDYAHTDDALRRACAALREVAPRRLIVVFGCGGDRDRGKRPLMGEVAGRGADLAVVTSDNPRTEDPHSILEMIVPGVERAGKRRLSHEEAEAGADGFAVEVDRRRAIRLAVAAARPGDVVLVAGKGHEDYQILGTTKIHFDDREEARAALLEKVR